MMWLFLGKPSVKDFHNYDRYRDTLIGQSMGRYGRNVPEDHRSMQPPRSHYTERADKHLEGQAEFDKYCQKERRSDRMHYSPSKKHPASGDNLVKEKKPTHYDSKHDQRSRFDAEHNSKHGRHSERSYSKESQHRKYTESGSNESLHASRRSEDRKLPGKEAESSRSSKRAHSSSRSDKQQSHKRRHHDDDDGEEEIVMTTHDGQVVRLKPSKSGNLEFA